MNAGILPTDWRAVQNKGVKGERPALACSSDGTSSTNWPGTESEWHMMGSAARTVSIGARGEIVVWSATRLGVAPQTNIVWRLT
eukprot:scaffold161396_cov30-Tisochrysis_lutea.AAC.9